MANPQKENGHVDIANEIVEALAKTYLSSYESQILWAIFRKTYGWHKKEDWITGTQLSGMTDIAKSHISRTLKGLARRNIIVRNGKKISFQKDYEQWEKLPIQATIKKLPIQDKKLPIQVSKVTYSGNKKLPIQVTTKETKRNYTKETIQKKLLQKKLSRTFEKCEAVYQLTIYLEGKIRENNDAIQKKYNNFTKLQKENQIQSWCKDIDKLIRIDKANPDEIKQIIDWVVEDDFWSDNILSANKLRKHYPRFYKKVIDRGKSLDEQIKNDHRFDDIEDDKNLLE